MTTYTKIDSAEPASISVYPTHKLSKINPNIYGGFTEHMGRCIYGGLYDPDNANIDLIDKHGFRKDVIEAMQDLEVPVVRYPGGNFVATYHWLDGVGPRENRPKRPELAWIGVESNQFGTDEFMKWCEIVGTEPYLALNFGTGQSSSCLSQRNYANAPQAHLTKVGWRHRRPKRSETDRQTALGWLEYCNSTRDTHYANLRKKHGREEPYNVKYWALGNETWGPWQVEQMTKEDYAKKAYQWAKALKLLDPTITLILCGETGISSWDYHVLKECVKLDLHGLGGSTTTGLIDMHSIHIYTAANDPVKNALAPRSAERAIEVCAGLIDLARIENGVPTTIPQQTICFDEWNVWDPKRAPGETGAEESYTLSDALAVAVWLNVFVRQSKYVAMANIAQSINVISPLMTTKDGIVKQTTWWPLLLFSKYMRGWTIATHVTCGEYEGDTEPAWMRAAVDTPWLDVSATVDEQGWVSMVVVNVSLDQNFDIAIGGLGSKGQVDKFVIAGEAWDVVNTAESDRVSVKESKWDGKGKCAFAAQSVTMLRWKA